MNLREWWANASAREKDALVAKTFGFSQLPVNFFPDTGLDDAIFVAEKMQEKGWRFSCNTTCDAGLWDVEFGGVLITDPRAVVVFTPLPDGICLAACLALGVEPDAR